VGVAVGEDTTGQCISLDDTLRSALVSERSSLKGGGLLPTELTLAPSPRPITVHTVLPPTMEQLRLTRFRASIWELRQWLLLYYRSGVRLGRQ